MLFADRYRYRCILVRAYLLNVRERRAGDDEAAVFKLGAFQLLRPLCEPVAVDRDKRQLVPLYFKQCAGVYRSYIVGRHCEYRLVYHALEDVLRQAYIIHRVELRHLGVIIRAYAYDVVFALAALNIDIVLFVDRDGNYSVRHAAYHLTEEPRPDDY